MAQQKKPEQKELGFDSSVPSRNDAKTIVEERKKSQKKTTVVAKSPKQVPVAKKAPPKKPPPKAKSNKNVQFDISFGPFLASFIIFVSLVLAVVIFQSTGKPALLTPKTLQSIDVEITSGMSARQIALLLEESGVIENHEQLLSYFEELEITTRLQPGTYSFAAQTPFAYIASLLVKPTDNTLLIYPGFTIEDIDALLVARKLIKPTEFSQAASLIAKERRLGFVEGWFISGTYEWHGSAYDLALQMQDALNEALHSYLAASDQLRLPLAQIVIIASMIQRETNKVSQMPLIAGVIYNRLAVQMSLGIDATLRYGLGVWDRPLTKDESASDSPFNTHTHLGLPPAGIGSPSLAALDAAMKPAEHQWFYYIHDRQQEIHPAKTYEEHKANIERYLQ
ncbi:MAG: endolytic transglycosylase MltG [Sphaerochaetaceae bacterium]|jgi:UPF0755 protein